MDLVESLSNVYDDVIDSTGAKKFDVYFYTKMPDQDPVWTKFSPTPIIKSIDKLQKVISGETESGDVFLSAIPRGRYTREQLLTSTEDGDEERYFVIDKRAYITVGVNVGYISYEVHLRLYESINSEDITPPEEVMSGESN